MDEQYWNELTTRVKSAEAFLRKSSYTHDIPPTEWDSSPVSAVKTIEKEKTDIHGETIKHVTSEKGDLKLELEPYTMETNARVLRTTLDHLNNAIEDGRVAFKNLIRLNDTTFLVGLSLVVLSAISGLFLQREMLAFIFGLLGISVLLSFFFMRPKEKIQAALSNLMQAQTVCLDFYNQLRFWAPYARDATSKEEKQEASKALHDATTFALKALEEYVEPANRDKGITPFQR